MVGRGSGTTRRVASAVMTAMAVMVAHAAAADRANAQKTYPPEVEEQCQSDYFRFCSAYSLGSLELRRCMETQSSKLSPNCRQALRDAGLTRSSDRRK